MKKTNHKTFSISNHYTDGNSDYIELPFASIKEHILGENYNLSLVFIDKEKAQSLNQTYRSKDYIPNILSFPLSETEGEIFICPPIAEEQASDYERTFEKYLLYLFIHGCAHLKGHDHGEEMEAYEEILRKELNV